MISDQDKLRLYAPFLLLIMLIIIPIAYVFIGISKVVDFIEENV